jgi:hypothetical protein
LEGKQVYKRFVTGSNKPLWYIIPKDDEKNNTNTTNKNINKINDKISGSTNSTINSKINNTANKNTNKAVNNKNIKFDIQEQKTISKPYIIIDLGNVHDCLQKLELYEGRVIAICNGAYLGYGVGEKCNNKNIEVIKYESLDGNTVMSEIFYKVSHLLTSVIDDIIVVSQSKFFTYLPEIGERHGKTITLVRDWDKLKTLI